MNQLQEASRIALRECLKLRKGESVLIVTDPLRMDIADALFSASLELGGKPLLIQMPVGQRDGEEPPELVAEMMRKADVVMAPTTKSVTHTAARRNACKAGARIATLPGITRTIMSRGMRADYRSISRLSRKLASLLTDASRVRVTTPAGTDIEMSIEGRKGLADTGLIHTPGEYCNLPAGEAYLSPLEGTAGGTVVIDGSMAGIGKLSKGETITFRVDNGSVRSVSGGEKAKQLLKLMNSVGEKGRNIAELGIGTNDRARVSGVVLEDEKVLGTVHIAVGNNLSMGGSVDVPLHLDGILMNPTVEVDGRVILKDKKIRI